MARDETSGVLLQQLLIPSVGTDALYNANSHMLIQVSMMLPIIVVGDKEARDVEMRHHALRSMLLLHFANQDDYKLVCV
jgi:hypothetical protein